MTNLGLARLQVERSNGRSVIVDQYSQAPLQLSKPLYLHDSDFPIVFLRSPSSGLLAEDVHQLDVQVGVGAQLELRTQGATLVYPGSSSLRIKIELLAQATMKFLPHPLILARGANFDQSIHVQLNEASSLLFKESWVCGRVAMGEEWRFQNFDNLIEIFDGSDLSYRECWSISPERHQLINPLICGAYKSFATTFNFGWPSSDLIDEQSGGTKWSLNRGRGTIQRQAVSL